MNIKKHIPNLFTLGNLFCGSMATVYAIRGRFEMAAIFVLIGIILDFFDGFLARMLKVQGELGKQLDSLADMVTSGVAPGMVLFYWLEKLYPIETTDFLANTQFGEVVVDTGYMKYFAFILILAACYRLAKFNIDTRQAESFIGMPTPAMSLFVLSLPIIYKYSEIPFFDELMNNEYFIIGIILVLSYLMNANLPLLSLKFKTFGVKENLMKYLLILTSVVLLITLKFLAIPLIIVVYILLSIINNSSAKQKVG